MTRWPALPARELARATPASRDRVIDVVRAASLVVVVLGHAVMALVYWRRGVPTLGNLLGAHRPAQLLTWVFQVVPLFFFAGGAANAISWRAHRDEGYAPWLWGRAARLLRPVLIYLALAAPLAGLISLIVPGSVSAPLLALSTQLLWFLGAYLVVSTLAPALLWLHARRPVATLAGLVVTSVAVDLARFVGHVAIVALVNFVTVWALCAQLGVWYLDRRLGPRVAGILALGAVALNALVVRVLHYPLSMVGLPGDRFSNMAPPTIVLMIHGLAEGLAVIALADVIRRLAARESLWRASVAVNASAMTLYLWRLPVLIVLYVAEHALGLDLPTVMRGALVLAGPHYLWYWVPHAIVFAAGVVLVVRVLWSTENAPLLWWDARVRARAPSRRLASALAGIGVVTAGTGLLILAGVGLAGFPLRAVHYSGLSLTSGLGVALLALGAWTVRRGAGRR